MDEPEDLEEFLKKYDNNVKPTPNAANVNVAATPKEDVRQTQINLDSQTLAGATKNNTDWVEMSLKFSSFQTQVDVLKRQVKYLRYSVMVTGFFAIIAMVFAFSV